MQLLLVYNAAELYHCLDLEFQSLGIHKPNIIKLYTQMWLQLKLWEIHNVPLQHGQYTWTTIPKSSRTLPPYLDSLVFNYLRSPVGVPTDVARVTFDFETGELFVRYY